MNTGFLIAGIAGLTALLMPEVAFGQRNDSGSTLETTLVRGQHVKVEGSSTSGVFRGVLVAIRDEEPSAKVEGEIELASSDRRQLRVVGFDVTLDRATRLYRGSQPASSRSMLTRGAWIEAKGTWRDGVLTATRIRLKEAPESTEEIEGPIESLEPETRTLVILNRQILLNEDVAILDERTSGSASAAPTERLRRDDDDGEARIPLAFGGVVLGGRMEAGFLDEQNFAIGRSAAERTALSRVQVLASSQVSESVEAYAKATFSRNLGSSARGEVRLSEAYLLFHDIGGAPLAVQVGRQRFRDSREWLFDEYLDAVRLHARLPLVKLESAVSRGVFSGSVTDRERRDQLQVMGSATSQISHVRLAFHVISRRDDTRGERPVWIAGMVDGSAGSWNYWGDLARRRGTSGVTRLAGWALDMGTRYAWRTDWTPTVTAGYAFGSGDTTRGDNVDGRFRQTDLEDNQAYFGGLRRVAIYGELFDPELTNLHVITAGIGVQPRRGLALDAVYHEYVQATATSSLPSSNLDGALTGVRRAIGREIDFIVTIRATRGFDIDLASGIFLPGAAFGTPARNAFFWRPQLRFYF